LADEVWQTDALVIGSGAGGAITAATLAEAGMQVLILEEGREKAGVDMKTHSPEAMQRLYRNGGLSPILGRSSIAFVEGCCVGGSTEINSSFWHHPPGSAIDRWVREYGVRDLSHEAVERTMTEIEQRLHPTSTSEGALPMSSQVFGRGLRALGLPASETPRLQSGDPTRSQFEPGAKASMSRTFLPRAVEAGARLEAGWRADRVVHDGRRASGVRISRRENGRTIRHEVLARHVFVCGGAIQTPALLRRSGIKHLIGDSLRIQPMLKVAALFDEILDADQSVMPIYQMHDPSTGFFLGGSVFTPGFLGMSLAERWPENEAALEDWRRMGIYYAACRGTGRGTIRVFPGTGEAIVRYTITPEDQHNLTMGMARLCEVLFAGNSLRVHPGLRDCEPLESTDSLQALLSSAGASGIPAARMSISTVHVSSSCPMGEFESLCPVDSFGRLRGFENLRLADASIIPDAPGVNPQGTVMALALRNARAFLQETRLG
jgi:choline dehydrogenase-like flavoprotein